MPTRPRLHAILQLVKLFARAARRGDGAAARDIEGVLISMIPAHARARQLDALRRVPELVPMLARRPQLPAGFGPDDVADCRPGTLGAAYVRLMRDFELDREFFPELDTDDDLHYFRRRMMETHDIWHVLTDYPADLEGELSIIGFYLGHFARYLTGPLALYNVVVGLDLVAGLLYRMHTRPWRLPLILARVTRAMHRGYRAAPLFAVAWEALWDRPLAELRQHYLPAPA